MIETALIGTTQESAEEHLLYAKYPRQGEYGPFEKLIRRNSVVGMTDWQLGKLVSGVEDKDEEPKASTDFFQGKVLMVSGAEVYSDFSTTITNIAAIPQKNIASTDEMITEAPSDLRDKNEIENEITKLLSWGSDIEFEQGMENEFTRALESMVLNYGDLSIEMLNEAIRQGDTGEDLISEIAQYLGTIINEKTNFKRRLLLIDLLMSSSNVIRYGAIIGLEMLNDSRAINDIETAIHNEDFKPLQIEMMEILDVLRSK